MGYDRQTNRALELIMKYLSLFSGVEAATVAWEPLGFSCIGVAENAPFPCAVLAHQLPDIPNLGDVRNVTKEAITDEPDIIIGGSPCQAFSVEGKRLGFKDDRGRLMFDFIRIVGECKPQYFVWENVKGVLSSSGGEDFATLLREMVKLGYDLEWRVLDTRWFGLPQSRNRVYLVGCLHGFGSQSVLFERKSDRGNTKTYSEAKKYGEYNPRRDVKFTEIKAIGNGRSVVGCLCARDYKGIGSDCVVMGKVIMETDLLSAETRLRRLTPVEYERLQGFPDNWTRVPWNGKDADKCPNGHRYKAMGNSMSIPVVKWIGERILQHKASQSNNGESQ